MVDFFLLIFLDTENSFPCTQVEAIRQLDVVRNRDVRGSRQLLFFAYALTMKGVIHELNYLGHTLQDAFGVIGQSTEEFEALFINTGTEGDHRVV